MKTNLDNVRRKSVLIVGFGKSGIAAAGVMSRLGAFVTVQDSKRESEIDKGLLSIYRRKGVQFCLDRTPEDMGAFDIVILSPGVSPELPFVQEAKEKGAEITGELELAYRIAKGDYVAITGTNGKTTTTTLTGEIFENSGRKTFVGGNIGVAVATEAAQSQEGDWLVTECSSFQLETTKYFTPKISAILNLSPDHLNRHHTFENYANAKAKIFANQREDSWFVTNYNDETCRKLAESCRAKIAWFSRTEEVPCGTFVKDGRITVKDSDGSLTDICGTDEIQIPGGHNVENVLAAAALAWFSGIDAKVIAGTVRAFKGVEHRLEYCANIDGVRYYNDSKGTNTDASITAVRGIGENIILIAGGDAKGQNFDCLVKEFPGRVKKLLLMGRDAGMIQESCDKLGFRDYQFCKDMSECVRTAASLAEAGDNVVLSPACASWDMYDNFEQRGRHFKELVKELER